MSVFHRLTIVTFEDELLSHNTLHRLYNDGRREWRQQQANGRVTWQDSNGRSGFDQLLDNGLIKRTVDPDQMTTGRELGFGRTVWLEEQVLTINRSSLGGRLAACLARIGLVGLLTSRLPLLESGPAFAEEAASKSGSGSGLDFGPDNAFG